MVLQQISNIVFTILAILPEGSVRDENAFLIMIVILIGLVGVAIILRRRRMKEDEDETGEEGKTQ